MSPTCNRGSAISGAASPHRPQPRWRIALRVEPARPRHGNVGRSGASVLGLIMPIFNGVDRGQAIRSIGEREAATRSGFEELAGP
jgi:hypothetical protein